MRRYLTIYTALMLLIWANCSRESPTVVPDPASQSFTGSVTGTSNLQLTGSYPESFDTGIPIDADIVLVFSKPVDITTVTTGTVSITDGVTPVTAFTPTLASGGRTVIINVTAPAALTYGATYTITITNGIQSDPVLDPPGYPLASGTSWDFTAATSTALVEAPRVIAATRYPANGATGVSVSTNYVEVTFTRSINNATIDTTSFTIAPAIQILEAGAGTGVDPDGVDTTTYRLYLNTPLTYGLGYTVDVAATIEDTDGNFLIPDTWTFTAETDPAPAGAVTIPSLWIDSVSDTGAVISFTTSKPVAPANCYVLYAATTPVTLLTPTTVQESLATTLTTVHTVTIPAATFTPSTRYYLRAGVDTGGGLPAGVLSATELSIYTKTDGTINETVSTAAGDQTGFVTVQVADGTGYAFWVDSGTNIYGKYFRSTTTPAGIWGANGTQVNTLGNMTKVTAINNGFSDAVV
ncbi:MAG TPA: Ig-like domain-containing protein, partial [Spirochaetota bacterium]|nr:Ig-like domain-containing protein [Spirochaetota bacterium]